MITLTHLAILEELNKLILRCALKNSVFGLETISISKEKVGGRLKKNKNKEAVCTGHIKQPQQSKQHQTAGKTKQINRLTNIYSIQKKTN